MKLTYDKEADALYIRLLEGEYQCRAIRLTDDIALDFAAGEKLVGIEVLGASRLFGRSDTLTMLDYNLTVLFSSTYDFRP